MRSPVLPSLAMLLTVAVSFQVAPSGQDETTVERDIYGRPVLREKSDVQKELLGCWRLVELDSAALLPAQGRQQAGYLLVAEDFLAIEIHVGWLDESDQLEDDDFQSGIHEYRFDRHGRLLTSSLIGGLIAEDERGNFDLAWETPGSQRRFDVQLSGATMTLTRDDGDRLTFQRQPARRETISDVYGRPVGPTPSERDAYGRGVQDEKQDEDE